MTTPRGSAGRTKRMKCSHCGHEMEATSGFCAQCGMARSGRGGSASGARGTRLLALAFVAVAVGVVLGAVVQFDQTATPQPTAAPAAPALATTDLSTMDPREAADRLYDRVMRAVSRDDLVEVRSFLSMAIAAYALVDSLGQDGAYHLAMLQRVGTHFADALATARVALDDYPDHLLVLSEAAEAALALGDTVAAGEYARRLLAAFDREATRDSVEDYDFHRNILPDLHRRAEVISGLRGASGVD